MGCSGGTEGTTLRGMPVVVITSRGAKSGILRKNPVMRVEHEGRYAAVASKGGAPEHPILYHNLLADPVVELQDGPVRQDMRARLVTGAEGATWWERAVAAFPDYAAYQTKTERDPGLPAGAGPGMTTTARMTPQACHVAVQERRLRRLAGRGARRWRRERHAQPVLDGTEADPLVDLIRGGVGQIGEQHQVPGTGVQRSPAGGGGERARIAVPPPAGERWSPLVAEMVR